MTQNERELQNKIRNIIIDELSLSEYEGSFYYEGEIIEIDTLVDRLFHLTHTKGVQQSSS